MAEYVKRTDLIDAVEELLKSPYANDNSENILLIQFSFGVRDALELVRDMAKDEVPDSMKIPSADVRENVRGKWLVYGDKANGDFECDKCGGLVVHYLCRNFLPNYCPNCGADMRGSNDV